MFKRVLGLENEYGISSQQNTDPITLSTRIVNAYAQYVYPNSNIRWDYDLENPLRDARGFDITRAEADFSLLTDEDQTIANIVIPNGARFYVDHAHPEYSAPETTNALDALIWDRAGEEILIKAIDLDNKIFPNDRIRIFKNNVDNKGASYGTHENYLTKRSTEFTKIIKLLTPHLITRQIFTGAGRIGIGQNPQNYEYQISQRADYIETQVGLETTLRRPIINTRDEPHSDPAIYRRLHLIIGDANMCDVATYLKIGTTQIVLDLIESDFLSEQEFEIYQPVEAVKIISHDISLERKIQMSSGLNYSALEIQEKLLNKAKIFLNQRSDSQYQNILNTWQDVLTKLRNNQDDLIGKVDWITKRYLLDKFTQNRSDYSDLKAREIDFKYSELSSLNSVVSVLRSKGLIQQLCSQNQIENALANPPIDTRAWFRGKILQKFSQFISAASWDSVILDLDKSQPLIRIPTPDPLAGTKAQTEQLFEKSNNINDLVSALQGEVGDK